MMTTIIPQIFINLTDYKPSRTSFYSTKSRKPANSFTRKFVCFYHRQGIRLGFESSGKLLYKDQFDERIKKKKRVVLVRFNNLNFNGGGGRDDGGTSRVLGNLILAIGLTYLSLTGQLGWILDAIVSVWLFVVLVPIVGFGALIWWASRDMVEIKCRNCGNEFEVFKSMLNDEPQLCPYCSQPFSVVGDEFVRDPKKFGKEYTTFGETFSELFSQSKKGKAPSSAVIDVEAEVKDVE
ncbi:hypothetical protein L1987_19561 [Smallanthus sonchifolius]|uniref:Uncharacterized protein n=1 Tax=Smallanthus sonchifolius TaxID=185202 RepID=A0ACB9IR68_9ASTR|nr:hypothetical protein L1987_19561 [Smallanthus sonchifolius]